MQFKRKGCIGNNMSDNSGGDFAPDGDNDSMGKEERMRQVLAILVESGLDLPPAVIFHNCKKRGATFERRSVNNYLDELQESGYVEKIPDTKGYYTATDEGREYYYNR
jgi:repressor of nif and glnA expression